MTTATKERKKRVTGTSVSVADLKRALHAVAPAVQARSPKPILSNVLLSGETLTGTDLELRITTPLDCYDGPDLLLPHERLTKIVGSLDQGDTVELLADGTSCIVRSGRGQWRLPVEDAREFPAAGEVDAKPMVHLPGDQFVTLMNSVRFATDNESSRYALGGVLIEFYKGMLSLIGTDGRRMCVAECEVDVSTDDFVREPKNGQRRAPIVPRRVVDVLCRLAGSDDRIQIDASDRMIVAEIGGTTIRAVLVDGRFPNWRDVEPTRTVKPSSAVVGALRAACRQAAICTSEQSKGVTFAFTGEGLHLTSCSAEAGEASCTCDLVESGDTCSVSLDPRFVTEWLGCGSFDDEETIEIEAENEQSAVVLRAQDCRCIVMPLAKD
jgi:DNA polymerase-3 subunit beta